MCTCCLAGQSLESGSLHSIHYINVLNMCVSDWRTNIDRNYYIAKKNSPFELAAVFLTLSCSKRRPFRHHGVVFDNGGTVGSRGKTDRAYGLLVTLSTLSCSAPSLVLSPVTGRLPIEKQQSVCAGTLQLHAVCVCLLNYATADTVSWLNFFELRQTQREREHAAEHLT